MVRRIERVVPGGPTGWRYGLACGHEVLARDYAPTRGCKDQAWCATCWLTEWDRPVGDPPPAARAPVQDQGRGGLFDD